MRPLIIVTLLLNVSLLISVLIGYVPTLRPLDESSVIMWAGVHYTLVVLAPALSIISLIVRVRRSN